MNNAVTLRGIVKQFDSVTANAGVDLAIDVGEIVALVGENGAGKSTLMNILYGLIEPDAGDILVRGTRVRFTSPLDAIRAGLGMVHQHFMLFPSLSVAENIVFAAEPKKRGLLDRVAAEHAVRQLAGRYGLNVDPAARVADLPVGIRQRVEILKLLYRSADVLIFDEPTAVLTPKERLGFFDVLARLRDQDKAIIFITHKLDEVMAISDRAVVMRDGVVTAQLETATTSPRAIASAMVGHDIDLTSRVPTGHPGQTVLVVEGLSALGHGAHSVRDVSFSMRAGEIVGIAGVAGNGQNTLIEALIGLRPIDTGRIEVSGQDVTGAGVAGRRRAGMAYIPEDRQSVGLADAASVQDNLVMGHHGQRSQGGFLRLRALAAFCRRLVERFAVKITDSRQPASALSGGNQQRLVVARELAKNAPVLIAEQPTRGVDISAVEFIHTELICHRDAGNAVLLVSADLAEILSLADRILVMYEGRIVADIARARANEAEIGLLMAGQRPT
ncbi:MAG: ABC transporter ATP-binding protein [Proteobacteria bacterium]|nr:ABC transporter ATP-binding protein [Pseudomonadota bacterium]